ncbi:hypothetical protein PG996_003285 [Apiospora saccharicola]|uniref:Uncharacterized protein n=1 Tax=Apiospora saccharicola TaxID=335842 RepID=A0ABR1W0W7_9PEZI
MTFKEFIRHHPVVGQLFQTRVTRIAELIPLLGRSAFVAIDTEYVQEIHDTLYQVGVAYIPDLRPPTRTPDDRLLLRDFIQSGQVAGKSLHVALSAEEDEEMLGSTGRQKMPTSWPSRLLSDEDCSMETLEHRLDALIQRYKEDAMSRGKDQLILVVFENAAEWKFMTLNFSRIARHFAGWLDVVDLGKEVNRRNREVPTLRSCLRVFGYRWPDISDPSVDAAMDDPMRRNNMHNAADDAAMTLGALEGFLSPGLREYMADYQGLRSIMSWHNAPPPKVEFAATLEPMDESRLPHSMGSITRAARFFWPHAPTLISISCESNRNWDRYRPKVGKKGWIAFETEAHLEHFIETYHGATLDGIKLQVLGVKRESAEMRLQRYRTSEQSDQVRAERNSGRDDYQSLRESGFELAGLFTD